MGKKHIDDICEKEWSRLFLLRRDNHLIDINSLVRLYVGFIGHVLEYGDVVWSNCTNKESDLLGSVQINPDRIITGLK